MPLDREEILAKLESEDGGSDLSGLNLSGVDLSRLDLRGVDLSRADLRGVNLSRADLSAADLRWAILEGADLQASVLKRADIRWAILRGANVKQADLGQTNLGWADVENADFSGAELDSANLDNVDMSRAIVDRPKARTSSVMRRPSLAPAGAGVGGSTSTSRPSIALPVPGQGMGSISIPQVTPAVLAGIIFGLMAILQGLGWLYRRSYFIDGFGLSQIDGLVTLGQSENFYAGLLTVMPLVLKALLTAPIAILALAIVLALIFLPIFLLWTFGEKILDDIDRQSVRPAVIGGLFVAYTVIFRLVVIPGIQWITDAIRFYGLPSDKSLKLIGALFASSGFFVKLGLLGALAACFYLLWLGWRKLSQVIVHSQLPLELRMRYPRLNAAMAQARVSPAFRENGPFTPLERRRGWMALAVAIGLLALLLAGAGRVQATEDMCDGGDLRRLQIYRGDRPAGLDSSSSCMRLVAETDDAYWVFFPSQTSEKSLGDSNSRRAYLREVSKDDDIVVKFASGRNDDCPTCINGPDGEERFIINPNELKATGFLEGSTGQLLLLDQTLDEALNRIVSISVDDNTSLTLNGMPSNLSSLEPGYWVTAFGSRDIADETRLLASEIHVIDPSLSDSEDGEKPLLEGDLILDTQDPWTPIFTGSGWDPNSNLEIYLVDAQNNPNDVVKWVSNPQSLPADAEITRIDEAISTDASGAFAAPITLPANIPTGNPATGDSLSVMLYDPISGRVAKIPWLANPLPTKTPTATPLPTARPTREPDPRQLTEQAAEQTEAAEQTQEADPPTETPEPTPTFPVIPSPDPEDFEPGPGSGQPPIYADCEADEFEPNNGRGNATVLYPGILTEPEFQEHNFCPRGDIDIFIFQAKAGRHYKVFTTELAPGVDTILAVGDLTAGTGCQPFHPEFGCWSDDRNNFEVSSEVIFEAIANDTVVVTVDNRGLRSGDEATYSIGVEQYRPGDEATPTGTGTITPTPTGTPGTRARDPWDDGSASNDSCEKAATDRRIYPEVDVEAILDDNKDEDWYLTIKLTEPGVYQFRMEPARGFDYDMDVGYTNTDGVTIRNRKCPFGSSDHRDGDAVERVRTRIPGPGGEDEIYVRVYGRPGSNDSSIYETYILNYWLEKADPPPPPPEPTSTNTPPTSVPPTATYTPLPPRIRQPGQP